MIGVAADGPGKDVDQFTLFVFENSAGSFVSMLDPSKCGPRHWGQFSARAQSVNWRARLRATKMAFINSGVLKFG